MTGKSWIGLGCVLAAIAVAQGAFAAHGLESWLAEHFPDDAEKRLANWKTAANYQMYHAIGLVFVGVLARVRAIENRHGGNEAGVEEKILRDGAAGSLSHVAGWATLIGIVLFSGMLYGWVLLDARWMVMLVPLGGLSFMLGWLLLALIAWKK